MKKLTFSILMVGTLLAGLAEAQNTLIGTFTVNYRYNAAGQFTDQSNPDYTQANPYYGNTIPPGPIFIDAVPGRYKFIVDAGAGCGVWSGDASSGTFFVTGHSPGEIVEFDHTFGQIALYYWDWYAGDNDPANETTISVFLENPCSVGDFTPLSGLAQQFEEAADPNTCMSLVDTVDLVQELKDAIIKFKQNLEARGAPSASFQITSGYRPLEYQAHIFEIATKYEALSQLNGVTAFRDLTINRPQLSVDPTISDANACQDLVDKVNDEIIKHCLLPGNHYPFTPPVCEHGYHELGRAFDLNINALLIYVPEHLVDKAANDAGLRRWCKRKDPVHFQLEIDNSCCR